LPAGEPLQERVDVPDPPAIDVEVKVHERLVELVVTVSVTVPENPLTDATVIVEVPATPTFRVAVVGLADIMKSCAWYVTVATWDRVPLVPVTVAR
jgi:hypothetical protein